LAAEAELCETLAQREEALKRKTNEEVRRIIRHEDGVITINSFESARVRYSPRWTEGFSKKCSS
jgi:hypothetical protein